MSFSRFGHLIVVPVSPSSGLSGHLLPQGEGIKPVFLFEVLA
jgi:hypothetical protein